MFVRHFHHYGGYGGYGPGFWLLMVGFVLLAVLFVVLIVMTLRASGGHRSATGGGAGAGGVTGAGAVGVTSAGSEAERILAERYARGELDDEEYQRRLRTLREPPG
jgi:putative membrane protein